MRSRVLFPIIACLFSSIFLLLGPSQSIGYAHESNFCAPVDTASIIYKLYKNKRLLPSKNGWLSSYKYSRNMDNQVISVSCHGVIDNNLITYVVQLKDVKNIFNKINFNIGDDYMYLKSYFIIGDKKIFIDKTHAINTKDDYLTQISNVWAGDKLSPNIKLFSVGERKVFLIKGINPFCNGHNCSDFVIYVLQKRGLEGTVNAIHFEGTNSPYDFNSMKLFYDLDGINPMILVPKSNRAVTSIQDFNTYKIFFDKIKLMN